MFFIPIIDLRDYASWVENTTWVLVHAEQLAKNSNALKKEYFADKKIIISSIFRYDHQQTYSYYISFIKNFDNIFLMTADNNLFLTDDASTAAREMFLQEFENNILLRRYPFFNYIGLLKGLEKKDYIRNKKLIQDNSQYYCLYLSGYIQTYRKKFHASNIVGPLLSIIDKPLFLYGCNPGSFAYIKKLEKSLGPIGIITESYKIKATHSGNFRYSRRTRIQKAWEKLQKNK